MKSVISVRVDDEVKSVAQEVAKSAGVSLSTLINAYLHQIAATRRIEIYAPEPMTPKLEVMIAEVEAERQTGQASEAFTSVDAFIDALDAD